MHLSVCSLLSKWLFWTGADGWRRQATFKTTESNAQLGLKEQEDFLKDHVLLYFEQNGFNMKQLFILFFLIVRFFQQKLRETKSDHETSKGTILLLLSDQNAQAPGLILSNWCKKFYDSVLFHRWLKILWVQAGDPIKHAERVNDMAVMGWTIAFPPSSIPLFHKRGVLLQEMATPEKASSSCQFYIVQERNLT